MSYLVSLHTPGWGRWVCIHLRVHPTCASFRVRVRLPRCVCGFCGGCELFVRLWRTPWRALVLCAAVRLVCVSGCERRFAMPRIRRHALKTGAPQSAVWLAVPESPAGSPWRSLRAARISRTPSPLSSRASSGGSCVQEAAVSSSISVVADGVSGVPVCVPVQGAAVPSSLGIVPGDPTPNVSIAVSLPLGGTMGDGPRDSPVGTGEAAVALSLLAEVGGAPTRAPTVAVVPDIFVCTPVEKPAVSCSRSVVAKKQPRSAALVAPRRRGDQRITHVRRGWANKKRAPGEDYDCLLAGDATYKRCSLDGYSPSVCGFIKALGYKRWVLIETLNGLTNYDLTGSPSMALFDGRSTPSVVRGTNGSLSSSESVGVAACASTAAVTPSVIQTVSHKPHLGWSSSKNVQKALMRAIRKRTVGARCQKVV